MDSRLLNIFHDDPFDGNYVKYDTDTQFWSSGSEALGLQLTETLHGILPIAPTEVVASTNLYNNSLLRDEDYSLESKHDSNTNSIIYEDYDEDATPIGMANKRQLASHQGIEIVAVDPNDEYDSDFLRSSDESNDEDEEDEENSDTGQMNGVVPYDEVRSYSRSTFRSRTDSSSIGDYESHSSDYDDESDVDDFIEVPGQNTAPMGVNEFDEFALHSDANELKKTVEDVDNFVMQLDASTFDLAAFITQDDQVFENHSKTACHEVICTAKATEQDSDSDVIVDVETVENDDEFWEQQPQPNNVEYVDNLKNDPSWSPNKQKSGKKEAKPIEPNFTRNFTVIPNKRQSNILKRKFGIGRGKNISMHRNPAKSLPKCKSQLNNNNVEAKSKNSISAIDLQPAVKRTEAQPTPLPVNVAKSECDLEKVAPKKPVSNGKCDPIPQPEAVIIKTEPTTDYPDPEEEAIPLDYQQIAPQKRKLNLEEYKKRRENPSAFPLSTRHVEPLKTPKCEASSQTTIPVTVKPPPSKPPQNEAITSIVKSLKESSGLKRFVDPITEAKNKVLRLQELKKAQQIKIIDSTVSSKVGRVTKLPPLKDIVKDTYNAKDNEDCGNHVITNPDYEEIIIVSTGCNTDITIPPNGYSTLPTKVGKNSSRSLLKSSVLLANISNSFQKVRSDDSVKISSNSLLVSIQDVVSKNSAPLPTEPIKAPQRSSSSMSEHGEDKVIMHLRKDRIRKRNFSQSVQTDLLPEFPALPPPPAQCVGNGCESSRSRSRRGRRRHYRARQNSYSSDEEYRARSRSSSSRSAGKRSRRHRSSISSSYSESEDYPKRSRYSGSSGRSRDASLSSGGRRSRSKSFDRVYRNSRSRSKSSSRSRSRSRRYDRHIDRNVSAPAVEERRIVYVGRIEQDTTKEMLRKKFLCYGPIKQITIHYKDTGMKYGFVTYEKSEDAFRVIDSGQNDATINMYDISFGGRRAFCRASYADLDNAGINTYQSYVVPRPVAPPKEEDSFEALLLKVKAKLNATKSSSSNSKI